MENILTIIIIVSLSFLDNVIPPAGIPIAVIFILFLWEKVSIKYLGLFKSRNWLKTIAIDWLDCWYINSNFWHIHFKSNKRYFGSYSGKS